MLILPDVLATEDVARVREHLAAARFVDGRKTAGGDARTVKANRQATGADGKTAALAEFVRAAIERHPVFAAYVRPARWSKVMFNAYGPGEAYGMHVDDPVMGKEGQTRLRTDLSFTLFLTDPAAYDGGELVVDGLEGERAVKLSAGSLAVYPTGQLHRVEPVTRGERLAAVGWAQSLIRRGEEREILFDLSRVRAGMKAGDGRLILDKSVAQLIRLWGEAG